MSFLYNVAQDIIKNYGEDLHNLTVVFPNKRASLFLNRTLAEINDKPVWSPRYTTISELFQSMSPLKIADRIKLVCELHKSYTEVTGKDETLEQFYGWGEMMLSDFDDIDKHMGDAKQIFSLLSNIHELDTVDYLTDDQVNILQDFFKNFTTDHSTVLKERFLELWNKFYDIYTHFKQSLASQGIAYEGMLYRDAIETSQISNLNPQTSYIFIGFNLLTPVEQLLITRTEGKIYNDDDKSCPPKELSFISSPTNDLQARYVSEWLTPERIRAGRKTAIVLADESLLETVLHCLPADISLNITTGYPLAQASISSLINTTITLLQRGSYTLHNINGILRHPLIKYVSPNASELHAKLNKELIYYLTPEEISVDEPLTLLFAPLKNKDDVSELTERLIWLTKTIATGGGKNELPEHDALTTEALYRMYTLLNRLYTLIKEEEVSLNLTLYTKLLNQIIRGTTIPFHGEPIEGIQIMGVLETRNLDFDHVLLLSCNEGTLPAKVNDSSFLPHSIRMAYNLTTVENKVAIYQYYFERLLQRTNDVTIVYNNSTSDGKTGEMSRFMLQLIASNEIPIRRFSLEAVVGTSSAQNTIVEKTSDMVSKLLERKYLSPSAFGKYLRCPMSFYYTYIKGIRDDDDSDEEEMDNRAFGTIFHRAAEILYQDFKGKVVPQDYIEDVLKNKGNVKLRQIAEQAFREELFHIKDSKRRTPKLGGLQVINFEMVVTFLVNLLRYDLSLTRLEIVDLEKEVLGTIPVETPQGTLNVRVGGKIDRLDMVTDKDGERRLRVLDYKTGRVTRKLNINDIDTIFLPKKIVSHTDYFLQALLYAYILDSERQTSVGLLYVQHAANEDYNPLLSIDGSLILDAKPYIENFKQGLSKLISEILDVNKPFLQTNNAEQCRNCSFYNFCH